MEMPPHPPRKSGHLYKKSGLSRSWKPRFFSLEGSILYYYKREGDTTPQGVVVLTGATIKPTRDKKYYSFRISHPKTSKVYNLAATLEERRDDWIDALRDGAHVALVNGPSSSVVTTSTSGSTVHARSDSVDSIPTMPEPEPTPSLSVSSFTMDESDLFVIASDDADLPLDHKAEMEALMCEFMEQARDDAEGWKLQAEQRDCRVFVRVASRMGSCKGVGYINHHPYLIVKLLLELHRRHTFDPQLMSSQRALVYDSHTFIDHLTYKAVFPASARDFVHITHWRVLHSGAILLVATSLKSDEQYPPKRDVVRGRTVMGGFLITPNEDYTGAHAQYIVKADVKGGIPAALQTKMFVKQAFVIDGLRRALEDEEYDRTSLIDLPRVTNRTTFDVRATEEEELDEMRSFSGSASTDADDTGDEDWSQQRPTITIPQEGLPAVPSKYRDMIQKAIARMDVEMNDSSWNFHSEKHGVKAYTKIDGSLTAAKGESHVAIHPRAIWELIMDVERKKGIDSQLAKGTRLRTLDAQTSIDYLEYKPIFVVSGRDFCNLTHWRVLSNGTVIIVAQSIEDAALCPSKEPKVVRGDLHIAGWKIVPDADYRGCHVTFMVKTDLKGSIPSRITSKVASEQPYTIHQIVQVLKKQNDLAKFDAQGPLTNTVFDQTVAMAMNARSSTLTKRTSSSAVRRSLAAAKKTSTRANSTATQETEPTPEPETKAAVVQKKPTDQAMGDVPAKSDESSTTNFILTNAVQFGLAIFALKLASLPGILHYGVIGYLAVYFITMLFMGPSHMTPRRKLMIATFGPPDSGMILGTLSIDVTKTQQYIADKREKTGEHITITHIVLRALGAALAKTPSVNGHLIFGNYYPAPTVDISCLVAVGGGKDLGVCRLPACDKMSLKEVCSRVRGDATKLRSGKDKAQDDRNKIMTILPTWVIRPVTNLVGWLGGCLGLRIPPVGVEPYMFGSCMVTSVGMMGLELAFAPLSPYAQTPMLVTIGAIKDTVMVEDGKIVVRPVLTLTTTIDHRYVDGSQAARMAAWIRQCIEDPTNIEPVDA